MLASILVLSRQDDKTVLQLALGSQNAHTTEIRSNFVKILQFHPLLDWIVTFYNLGVVLRVVRRLQRLGFEFLS